MVILLPLRVGLVAFVAAVLRPAIAVADTPPAVPVEYTPPATLAAPHEVSTTDTTEKPATRFVAVAAAGVAVVGVGVGAAFGVLALNSKSAFDAHPTVARADTGNQEAVLADVAFGTAVIAGVTSVVLFLRSPDGPAPPATETPPAAGDAPGKPAAVSFTMSPLVSAHGAGVGAFVRF
jgi:hypothetical protein